MYKLSIVIILTGFFLISCNESKSTEKKIIETQYTGKALMSFDSDFYDFGSITQGEIVAHSFKFRNTGEGPLLIQDAIPDCGCTKPKYKEEPIMPGDSSYIEIAFDSAGWRGSQYKQITFVTNTDRQKHTLTIRANVLIDNNY